MDLFDFWIGLSLTDLVRLLLPAGLLALATLLPGRDVARIASFGIAAAVPFLRELGTPWPLTAAWSGLWALVGWQAGRGDPGGAPPARPRGGGVESGTVGLLIGLTLLLLLVASLARQDLAAEVGRRVILALVLLGLGLLHLMLRRHVRRAAIAFAALGLGLQLLDSAARAAQLAGSAPPSGGVWLASALAVALAIRLGGARERHAGTAWVSDAHDLHD